MDKEKELKEVLQAIRWFQSLSEEHFNKIAAIAKLVSYDKDELIFKQGDTQEYLYIVVEGRVGVELYSPVRGYMRVFTAEAMDVIGWSSVTPVVPCSSVISMLPPEGATARVNDSTDLCSASRKAARP